MKAFMDKDFLLENETARTLFHKYAENQPIYDYHNHLPPREIAERKQYENLTQLWLAADHYKWRAMRACGVDERYITGNAPDDEKFRKWAEVVPQLVGCPLYHWTHLELQRYFEIDTPLTPETAPAIWAEAAASVPSKTGRASTRPWAFRCSAARCTTTAAATLTPILFSTLPRRAA